MNHSDGNHHHHHHHHEEMSHQMMNSDPPNVTDPLPPHHNNHHHDDSQMMHRAHNSGGDGGGGGEGHTGHNMMMYFHGGWSEVILFDFWRINSLGGLIGSILICFLLGILHEAVKFARDHIIRNADFKTVRYNSVGVAAASDSPPPKQSQEKRTESSAAAAANTTPSGSSNDYVLREEESLNSNTSTSNSVKIIETGMFSIGHLMLTALHLVQFTLAYILMLIVMTYNTWLCLATVLGSTVGYFLFGWRKNAIVDVSDHCH